ncbi:MAG: cyclomaltodextrinase, partial [Candidatus Cloacimonetes bacterium]|nr:cyclomaltodextrinase [Candidatus Cloacimonadota bacterium]
GKHLVGIAGDHTNWKIIPLENHGGIYQIDFNLPNGNYLYKFIVDGLWMPDPSNPESVADPFGGRNSLLSVSDAVDMFSWADIKDNLDELNRTESELYSFNRISENEIEVRFRWWSGLNSQVKLLCDNFAFPMYRLGADRRFDVFHRVIDMSGKSELHLGFQVMGSDAVYLVGANGIRPQDQTSVFIKLAKDKMPLFSTPEWVRNGIVYQIFPDRFCNGDPANDPDFTEWYYENCRDAPPEGEYLPAHTEFYHLVLDWYDLEGLRQNPYLPNGKPDWWSFYGGDLAGCVQKIPYLEELGITIIYFNPLWQAKSNHKYDAADFMRIDPHFGTEAEMKELVSLAHDRGIRIIIDIALNHTGETYWAFRDCLQKGEASPYWLWYDWKKWPLPDPLPPDFNPKDHYQCWWGIKDMPDLNYDHLRHHPEENAVRDIALAKPNQPLLGHLDEMTRWWLLEIGIDGFRLDVPDEVPFWFWQRFRHMVKTLKPDAWLVGEIWNNAQEWLNGLYFDSVMNYAYFKTPVLDYFVDSSISTSEFVRLMEEGLASYPLQSLRAMMNLLGSHDTWRIITLADNEMEIIKQMVLFQMCYLGTPHIYYGDEIMMQGEGDPDNRRPFNWHWQNRPEAVELREFIRSCIALRKQYQVLIDGEIRLSEESPEILSMERFDDTHCLKIVINRSVSDCSLSLADVLLQFNSEQNAAEHLVVIKPRGAALLRL